MIKKCGSSLYVWKKTVNTILNKINITPPITGFFQDIINTITRTYDGIKWIKKPSNSLTNGSLPGNESNAKSDMNKINIIASTPGIHNNLEVFINFLLFYLIPIIL